MKINVQSIHFDADRKLLDYIETKIAKLDHYFDQIIQGDIYLKVVPSETVENKQVEIKLAIPGKDLFCSEIALSFEAATDLAMDCMKIQIHKHKERVKEHASNHKQLLNPEDTL
ncbi:MAG: ribosome-associated translation inhibitor RaiA [Sphingobacteriaceae bacterium]|nr:ribosome-associated translation inhibitor RaiA [Sphingobacteriaceae bacterium]